jgi:hypothetical protein
LFGGKRDLTEDERSWVEKPPVRWKAGGRKGGAAKGDAAKGSAAKGGAEKGGSEKTVRRSAGDAEPGPSHGWIIPRQW